MKLRWYDWIVCIGCADMIAAGIVAMHWIGLLGVVNYLAYEMIRRT